MGKLIVYVTRIKLEKCSCSEKKLEKCSWLLHAKQKFHTLQYADHC